MKYYFFYVDQIINQLKNAFYIIDS